MWLFGPMAWWFKKRPPKPRCWGCQTTKLPLTRLYVEFSKDWQIGQRVKRDILICAVCVGKLVLEKYASPPS